MFSTMTDLMDKLTGTPSEATELDTDLASRVQSERDALQAAIERKEELEGNIEELENALAFRKEAQSRADALATVLGNGYVSDLKDAESEIEDIERAIETAEADLQEAEADVAEARSTYEEALQEAREGLMEEMKEVRDQAHERIDKALNEAQAANLELLLLRTITQNLEGVSLDVRTIGGLIPDSIDSNTRSFLTRVRQRRRGGPYGKMDYQGELQHNPDPSLFREMQQKVAEAAEDVAPIETSAEETQVKQVPVA